MWSEFRHTEDAGTNPNPRVSFSNPPKARKTNDAQQLTGTRSEDSEKKS